MKKFLVLFFFIIASCGYQPLYKTNKESNYLKIKEINFIGDINLSKKIYSKLPFILVKKDESLNLAILESSINITESSKNSKGQVTSYRTTLALKLKILSNDNKIINEKSLQKEFTYNTGENKFQFKEYQDKIKEDLVDDIVEDVIFYLNYL